MICTKKSRLAHANNSDRLVGAALQKKVIVSGIVTARSSTRLGLVRESVGERSTASISRYWRLGGTSGGGGHDSRGSGGEGSNGGGGEVTARESSASVLVPAKSLREGAVQVVEGHVIEDGSEKVGIDGTVLDSTLVAIVGGLAEGHVVVGGVKREREVGEHVGVLHGDVASDAVVDSDAVLAVVPGLAESVDLVHDWASSRRLVAKVAPASVVEHVRESEQVHGVSVVIRAASSHVGSDRLDSIAAFGESSLPHGAEIVGHGHGG